MSLSWRGIAGLLAAVSLAAIPAWANVPGRPGTINYVEGKASIGSQAVTSKDVGRAELDQNQSIKTSLGKAEVLLTPGVFLRLGDHSELRMISPGLSDTQVELIHGEAQIEVTDISKENHIRVINHGVSTTLVKKGLYSFNAETPTVSVYEGKAEVQSGDSRVSIGKGKQVFLTAGPLRAVSFDREHKDELYQWSSLRDRYLAEASMGSARVYVVNPYGWYGSGWYWNPYFSAYSFIPGAGYLYSPFGYGFYSPFAFYGYGYGGGFYRGGGFRRVAPVGRSFGGGAGVRGSRR